MCLNDISPQAGSHISMDRHWGRGDGGGVHVWQYRDSGPLGSNSELVISKEAGWGWQHIRGQGLTPDHFTLWASTEGHQKMSYSSRHWSLWHYLRRSATKHNSNVVLIGAEFGSLERALTILRMNWSVGLSLLNIFRMLLRGIAMKLWEARIKLAKVEISEQFLNISSAIRELLNAVFTAGWHFIIS